MNNVNVSILFHSKAYILIAISSTILKPEVFPFLCTEMIRVFKRGSQNWVSKHTTSGGEAVGSKCLQGQPKCLLFSDVFTGRGLPFVSEVCWPELLRDCVLLMFTGTQGRMCYYIHVVCLALGFQNHLELSGHFLRASESSLYIRCQEPGRTGPSAVMLELRHLRIGGEGLICSHWLVFLDSVYDTPVTFCGLWVVLVMGKRSKW